MKRGKRFRKQSGKNQEAPKKGIDWNGFGFPKGETSLERRNREQKQERAVKTRVRAIIFRRDPACMVPEDPRWPHGGPDEWGHLEEGRRTKTTGQDPEERHTTALGCRICRTHHRMYDGQQRPRLSLVFLTEDQADGAIEWYVGEQLVGGGR